MKTRLIPALGAEGACELHEQLTRDTLAWATRLHDAADVDCELHYAGASAEAFQARYPGTYSAHPQADGDLGARLETAFANSFAKSAERVVIVGTDCPLLNERLARQAFEALASHDVVLGPALDGGYYLIGLRAPQPTLFAEMPWSEPTLLTATLQAANAAELSVHELPCLSDIDRPADLRQARGSLRDIVGGHSSEALTAAASSGSSEQVSLSIIIPVLGDAAPLRQTLAELSRCTELNPDHEVIVASGGDHDTHYRVASEFGAQFVGTVAGRGRQMNAAAAVASCGQLLFLHADTQLPVGYQAEVRRLLADPAVALGAFRLEIAGNRRVYRWLEGSVQWRSRWLGLPYGDQAFFMRADTFWQLGGFREIELMEDFEFTRRAKQQGRIELASLAVRTSDRRWRKHGVPKVTLLNQLIVLGFFLGISPARLARWYRGKNRPAKADVIR